MFNFMVNSDSAMLDILRHLKIADGQQWKNYTNRTLTPQRLQVHPISISNPAFPFFQKPKNPFSPSLSARIIANVGPRACEAGVGVLCWGGCIAAVVFSWAAPSERVVDVPAPTIHINGQIVQYTACHGGVLPIFWVFAPQTTLQAPRNFSSRYSRYSALALSSGKEAQKG